MTTDVDYTLLYRVRQLIDGTSIHIVQTWVFLYEKSPVHSKERDEYESILRKFVTTRSLCEAARWHAMVVCNRAADVTAKSESLDKRLQTSSGIRSSARKIPPSKPAGKR